MTVDLDAAFLAVPRAGFVPAFLVPDGDRPGWYACREPDPQWRAGVAGDDALVTQVDDVHADDAVGVVNGVPTSSSSAPPLMRLMLDALDLGPGHRVLEIGTGTGYNAGILAHALGSDAVTSVDIDAVLVARARARLADAGHTPTVVVGDGCRGHAARAPYDRVVATVAVERVPAAWFRECAPYGRLVVALDRGGGGGLLVALDVVDDGRAEGRLLPDYGGFMPLRELSRSASPRLPDPTGTVRRPTALDPAQVSDPKAPFEFYAALRLGGLTPVRLLLDGGGVEDWVLRDDGAWACIDDAGVRQGGPSRLWDLLERAYAEWSDLGRPPAIVSGSPWSTTDTPGGSTSRGRCCNGRAGPSMEPLRQGLIGVRIRRGGMPP